jgi:hypothetical protein
MPSREDRCAENQYRFNDVNNRFRELVEELAQPAQRLPFLCECADDSCLGRVELGVGEFAQLHDKEGVFVILPGHPRVNGEVVLQREDRFEQVEKRDA